MNTNNQQMDMKGNVFHAISKENQYLKQTNDIYKQTIAQLKTGISQSLIMLQQQNKYSFIIERMNAIQNTLVEAETLIRNKEALFNQTQNPNQPMQQLQQMQMQMQQTDNTMNMNQFDMQNQQQQFGNQQMMYPVNVYNQQFNNDINQTQFIDATQMQQTQMMYPQYTQNMNDQTNFSRPFLDINMENSVVGGGMNGPAFINIDE